MNTPDPALFQNLRLPAAETEALRAALRKEGFKIKGAGELPAGTHSINKVSALPPNLRQGDPCPKGIIPLFIGDAHRFSLSPLNPGWALTAVAA